MTTYFFLFISFLGFFFSFSRCSKSPAKNSASLTFSDPMGLCHGKPIETRERAESTQASEDDDSTAPTTTTTTTTIAAEKKSFPFYSPSPLRSLFRSSPANSNSSVASTPLRVFKRPFPPPSPAKHIRALLRRRHGSIKPNEASIPEGDECDPGLDKAFGFSRHFGSHYELAQEIGRGHFGYTCSATAKKGSLKGLQVAVKLIPKSKVYIFSRDFYFPMIRSSSHFWYSACQTRDTICFFFLLKLYIIYK